MCCNLLWRFCSEFTSLSLCCQALVCQQNMSDSLRAFRAEYQSWRSDWLKRCGDWQPWWVCPYLGGRPMLDDKFVYGNNYCVLTSVCLFVCLFVLFCCCCCLFQTSMKCMRLGSFEKGCSKTPLLLLLPLYDLEEKRRVLTSLQRRPRRPRRSPATNRSQILRQSTLTDWLSVFDSERPVNHEGHTRAKL